MPRHYRNNTDIRSLALNATAMALLLSARIWNIRNDPLAISIAIFLTFLLSRISYLVLLPLLSLEGQKLRFVIPGQWAFRRGSINMKDVEAALETHRDDQFKHTSYSLLMKDGFTHNLGLFPRNISEVQDIRIFFKSAEIEVRSLKTLPANREYSS